MRLHFPSRQNKYLRPFTAGLVLIGLILAVTLPASGAMLGPRSMTMSSSVISSQATYKLAFDLSTAGTLGSILIQFCTNTPEVNDPCVAPVGQSVANVTLTDQSGAVGFAIAAGTNANTIVLSRAALPSAVGQVSYTFAGAVNPSANGTYFTRIQTFASTNATGAASDYGSIAFSVNNRLSISADVDPFLIFCAALTIPQLNCSNTVGDFIDFGELSTQRPAVGTSQVFTATNAKDGYNVTVAGTTLTSGNNIISQIVNRDVSRPGTAQFGMNLRANSSPSSGQEANGPGVGAPTTNYNLANFYQFNNADIVIAADKPDDARRYTISYIVNVPNSQASGVYVSTITYIALGSF